MNPLLMMVLTCLTFVYIIMFAAYLFMGLDKLEDDIGIGYTKKHLKLWFGIAIFEASIIGWMYLACFG